MATTEEVMKAAENNGVNPIASTTANLQAPAYADQNRINAINAMYDSQINSQRANLESAYNQNMSDLEANRTKIAREYQTQRNARAVDFERARRNFNQQAMMNGLNTGAFSQANLAQNNAYNKGMADIGVTEGTAHTELERTIAATQRKDKADINKANAPNDDNKAAALLDEYNNAYSQAMTKAQHLAQYGDFSGYSALYGADAARQMSTTWALQNPLIAYNLGRISAAQYKSMTGTYPPSYSTGGSSGGGGGYYRRGGSSKGSGGGSTDGLSANDIAAVLAAGGTSGTATDRTLSSISSTLTGGDNYVPVANPTFNHMEELKNGGHKKPTQPGALTSLSTGSATTGNRVVDTNAAVSQAQYNAIKNLANTVLKNNTAYNQSQVRKPGSK